MSPGMKVQYIQTSEELQPLEKILKEWTGILKYYTDKVKEIPWYRERTHVGFFAAASWLAKVPALEEWTSRKAVERRKYTGRCDLWIMEDNYFIEAKHIYCSVTGRMSKIKNAIDNSRKAAQKMKPVEGQVLAFTFLGAIIPKNALKKDNKLNVDNFTQSWLQNVLSLKETDKYSFGAIAWYLPNRRKKPDDRSRNFEIGTVLLIHQV